jgi:hypothetical protein
MKLNRSRKEILKSLINPGEEKHDDVLAVQLRNITDKT